MQSLIQFYSQRSGLTVTTRSSKYRQGVKMGPGPWYPRPWEPETRDPGLLQSLKVRPRDPFQILKKTATSWSLLIALLVKFSCPYSPLNKVICFELCLS